MATPAKTRILQEGETRLNTIAGVSVFRSENKVDYTKAPLVVLSMGASIVPEDEQVTNRDTVQFTFRVRMLVNPPFEVELDDALADLHMQVVKALLKDDPGFGGLASVIEQDTDDPDVGDETGQGHIASQTVLFLATYHTTAHDPGALIIG